LERQHLVNDERPLRIFAQAENAPPLRHLLGALAAAGHPARIGVRIAGEATEEELESPDWDAAFIRWTEPELHEVCLVERLTLDEDDEAVAAVAHALREVASSGDHAGELIVADHLRHCRQLFDVTLLPALMDDSDHAAWSALDILLRTLAERANGLIYVQAEGYCDATGELLLSEEDMNTVNTEPNDA
jgi:hypothetical protein